MLGKILRVALAVLLGTVAMCCVLVVILILKTPPLWSQEAAGWAQAIGSIAAIGVAIWVSHEQHQKQEIRDRQREINEIRALLRSLRGEISTAIESIEPRVGKLLEASPPGSAFRVTYPVPEDPFSIYNAVIPKLGLIADDDLRNQIILTYGRAKSLVMSFRFNNEMLERFLAADAIARRSSLVVDVDDATALLKSLEFYGDSLRTSYAEVKQHVTVLLKMLEKIG